ncbi:MAG: shikimate dehydrogenase [Ignavibacteria bacterium RBG_16_34_14]|nr:MAG: shikimate dehydrogenase [Ignavibacteria bacterium RBG_16_34_14]
MKDTFHLNTKIIGLIGHPIKQTYSPFIHNVAAQMKNLDYIYLPFDVPTANLRNALRGMIALNIKGFNVTIPHKENIVQFLNNVSEEASIIGSINTVVNEMGKLNGYNTDVDGALATLIPYKNEINGMDICVVGAGGGARAVIYALIRYFKPKKIFIINRTEQRAEALKNYFSAKMKYTSIKTRELFPPDLVKIFKDSKLIVNATSVGMFPDSDDIITSLSDSFVKDQLVFDLVYNPPETKLLQLAASNGAIVLDGVKMLVHQAAKSFELWTGEKVPIDELQRSLMMVIKN